MAAQAGKDIVVQINSTGSTYVDCAGLRAKEIKLGADTIDITSSDSTGRWRELLGASSTRSCSISGSGVFLDAAVDATMQTKFYAEALVNFKFVVPDFGTFAGAFKITELTYSGDHDGEVTYDVSFESSGVITFTAI